MQGRVIMGSLIYNKIAMIVAVTATIQREESNHCNYNKDSGWGEAINWKQKLSKLKFARLLTLLDVVDDVELIFEMVRN